MSPEYSGRVHENQGNLNKKSRDHRIGEPLLSVVTAWVDPYFINAVAIA